MTPGQKLDAVERTIEDFRWTRDHDKTLIEYQTYLAMCEIASELRKGVPEKAGPALVEIQKHVDAVERSRTDLGFSINALRGLAVAVMERWPTVRKALEHFEKETV